MAQPLIQTMQTLSKVRNLHNDHVFTFKGQPIGDIRKGIEGAVGGAKLEYGRKGAITYKTLRHTFRQHCRRAGVELSEVKVLMGHRDDSISAWYDSIEDLDLRNAIEKLERYRKTAAHQSAQTDHVSQKLTEKSNI